MDFRAGGHGMPFSAVPGLGLILPAEPAFPSRDVNNNTNKNTDKLGLGVSFSAGLPGWSPLIFFTDFIKKSNGGP